MGDANYCGMQPMGDDKEFEPCNTQACFDVDCELGDWSMWSACSCSCDGVKRRSRRIVTYGKGEGRWCNGDTKQIHSCNFCGLKPEPPVDCSFTVWSTWTTCSATCD